MLGPPGVSPSESEISQIASEPTDWENKTVKICGIVQNISFGVIHPFNYWLCDKQNQTMRIGIKCHSDTDLSGKSGGIVGVVKKGYAWVNPNFPSWLTYYIDATSICQD